MSAPITCPLLLVPPLLLFPPTDLNSGVKRQKRAEEWAFAKAKEVEESKKKKKVETRKLICKKAIDYAQEREARLKGGFYVSPEAKLLFIVRIRGMHYGGGVMIGVCTDGLYTAHSWDNSCRREGQIRKESQGC
ncbi:hypothetical protein ACP275_05G129300 [Erythranthe tilingii]